jgi:hypothetical protein
MITDYEERILSALLNCPEIAIENDLAIVAEKQLLKILISQREITRLIGRVFYFINNNPNPLPTMGSILEYFRDDNFALETLARASLKDCDTSKFSSLAFSLFLKYVCEFEKEEQIHRLMNMAAHGNLTQKGMEELQILIKAQKE